MPSNWANNCRVFIHNNSLQCYNENEDCEDANVEQIAAKHQKTSEYHETD
jgi:hypothetical protein